MNSYLLFKSLHLIAVVSWMAGLLYLPRIFVYHVENKEKKDATDIFEVMEKRLFFYIMRPAMIFTWVFGLVLIYINGIDIFSHFSKLKYNASSNEINLNLFPGGKFSFIVSHIFFVWPSVDE